MKGVSGKKWETRFLHRCMRRLYMTGLMKRVKARDLSQSANLAIDQENPDAVPEASVEGGDFDVASGQVFDPKNDTSSAPEAIFDDGDADVAAGPVSPPSNDTSRSSTKIRWVRCIKMTREPEARDKAAFVSTAAAARALEEGNDNSEPEADEEDMADSNAVGALNVVTGLGQSGQMTKSKQRIPPQWDPSLHQTQLVFNLVQSFGTEGVSTMDLTDCTMGHFWKRPLDELLGRMSDMWRTAQPTHLRHLSVVRDTGFNNKSSFYQFRTFNNFKQLVDAGAVTWEAIGQDSGELETESIDLDEWGFPSVEPEIMVGGNGVANVATCKMFVEKPNRNRSYDPSRARRVLKSRQSSAAMQTPKPASRRKMIPSAQDDALAVEQSTALSKWPARNSRKPLECPTNEISMTKSPKPSDRQSTGRQLFMMTPQRLDAERLAWNMRVKRLAKSLALVEASRNSVDTGTGSNTEGQPPQKRRKVMANDDKESSATDEDPPDVRSFPELRALEIETELQKMSEPRIYINPPGSGQAKMTIIRHKGRPSKYLIAVCKSSKLKAMSWFAASQQMPRKVEEPVLTGYAKEDDSFARESQRPMSQEMEDRVSIDPAPDYKVKADFVIKGGKRKSTVTLGGHAAKKQAIVRENPPTTFTAINAVTTTNPSLAPPPQNPSSSMVSPGDGISTIQTDRPREQEPASPFTELARGESIYIPTTQMNNVIPDGARREQDSSVEGYADTMSSDRGHNNGNVVEYRPDVALPSPSQDSSRQATEHFTADTTSAGNANGQNSSLTEDEIKTRRKKVDFPTSGGLIKHQREIIMLGIIRKSGGIFAGDKELFFPFLTEWEKAHGQRPDRSTSDRVLKTLVSDGKLRRFPFTFPGRYADSITKHVVTEPDIDPESEAVKHIQQKIIDAYPHHYLPPEVELAPFIRSRIQNELKLHASATPRPKQLTIKDVFVEDESEGVRRLHPPPRAIPVKLGMTQANLERSMASRKRRREQEQKRKDRYLRAQLEDEIDEASSALQTDFQLDGYEHDPNRARINRGPHGRSHLSKLMGWGASGRRPLHKKTFGDLGAASPSRGQEESKGRSNLQPHFTGRDVLSSGIPTARSGTSSLPFSGAAWQKGNGTAFAEIYTLLTPYQRFHERSGTFGTDPVVVTLAGRPAWFESFGKVGLANVQLSMQLADVYRSANVTMLPAGENSRALTAGRVSRRPPTMKRIAQLTSTSKILSRKEVAVRASRSGIFSMSKEEEKRLVIAVVISRTLVGGLEQTANWGIVHQIFHYKFDGNYCRNRWSGIRSKYASIADKLQETFQDLFLQAYEKGELPAIDFLEPEKYDWNTLLEWAEARLNLQKLDLGGDKLPDLPTSREALDYNYEMKVPEEVYGINKEDYWAPHITLVRREELAKDWTHTIVERSSFTDRVRVREEDSLLLAKSWVRANVLTPEGQYDSICALKKLDQIGEDTINKALEALLGAKIIRIENRGRTVPGRNYDISDQVLATFKRSWDANQLRQAAEYKVKVLDAAFIASGRIEPAYDMPDYEMLCVTNLVARGYVKVIPNLPPVNNDFKAPWPKLTKWGFTDGNYKTVHLDRTRLDFGFSVVPTERYIYGNPTKSKEIPSPLGLQVAGEIGDRLPLWTDIHGKRISSVWDMMVMATLHLLAFRPGMTANTLVRAYKDKLWLWEIELFLKWAEEAGILQRMGWAVREGDDAAQVGWTTTDWWWLALDGYEGGDGPDMGSGGTGGASANEGAAADV